MFNIKKVAENPLVISRKVHLYDPLVCTRASFGLENKKLCRLCIAGRPTKKHGGSHGQHTTAFSLCRQALVNALSKGIEIDTAKSRISDLFARLKTYPGIIDNNEVCDEYSDLLNQMCDSDNWPEGKTLNYAMRLYCEMRDAIPGTSLPAETHADTTYKGEQQALKTLIDAERQLLKPNSSNCDSLTYEKINEALLKLIDISAIEKLDQTNRVEQLAIFVHTVADAFPGIFLWSMPIEQQSFGEHLIESISEGLRTEGAQVCFNDKKALLKLCLANAKNAKTIPGYELSDVTSFGVEMRKQPDSDTVLVQVQGRPDSRKSGDISGDHTTSFRTICQGVIALFMSKQRLPNKQEFCKSINQLCSKFHVSNYRDVFPALRRLNDVDVKWIQGLFEAFSKMQSSNEDYSLILDSDEVDYFYRLCDLYNKHKILESLSNRVSGAQGDSVDSDLVLDAIEAGISLVDARPTSVVYLTKASGHGEGQGGVKLDQLENSGGICKDKAEKLLMSQFDTSAIRRIRSDLPFASTDTTSCTYVNSEEFISKAIEEFSYLVSWRYPCISKKISSSADIEELKKAIANVVDNEISVQEYKDNYSPSDDDSDDDSCQSPPTKKRKIRVEQSDPYL